MNRSISLVVLFAALSTAACSGSSEESAATNADAVTGASAGHHAKVVACEKANEQEAGNAGSTMEMIAAEANFSECLTAANDAAVPVIEGILKENESASAGSVKGALDAARLANQTLCEELYKASPNFGGSLQRVEAAGCSAAREHLLAKVVDDMVAFPGTEPTYIKDDRASHAACYAAYDKSDPQSTAEMIGVNSELSDCVRKSMDPLLASLARTQVENDAEYGPLAAANARVITAVDGQVSSVAGLCGTLSEAGENGIGTLSRVSGASCAARVMEAAYTTLKNHAGVE